MAIKVIKSVKKDNHERFKQCLSLHLFYQLRVQTLFIVIKNDVAYFVSTAGLLSPQSSSSKSSQDEKMPKEVFIVDIKRSRTGLGVGLIDGLATSLVSAGVYVRSLIPDNPSTKVGKV